MNNGHVVMLPMTKLFEAIKGEYGQTLTKVVPLDSFPDADQIMPKEYSPVCALT